MDLFGRKAKAEVAQLKRQIINQADTSIRLIDEINNLNKENALLVRTLRNQDQLIFTMSQQPTWEFQAPHFRKLLASTESRMRTESDRIRDVLIPEVRKAYTESTSKEWGHGEALHRQTEHYRLSKIKDDL